VCAAPCFVLSVPHVKTVQKFLICVLKEMTKLVPFYKNHEKCLIGEALRLIQLMKVCTMHAGTAGDLANRAVAKQLLAPPDWGCLAAPLIRVAHSIVETTFSVIKGAVHGLLHLCLASRVKHPCYLCFLPSSNNWGACTWELVHGETSSAHGFTFCADACKGKGPWDKLPVLIGFAFCAGRSKGKGPWDKLLLLTGFAFRAGRSKGKGPGESLPLLTGFAFRAGRSKGKGPVEKLTLLAVHCLLRRLLQRQRPRGEPAFAHWFCLSCRSQQRQRLRGEVAFAGSAVP